MMGGSRGSWGSLFARTAALPSSKSRNGSTCGGCRASNPFWIRQKTQETPYLLGKPAGSAGQSGSENAWQNTKRLAVRLAVDSQTEDPEAGLWTSSGRHLPLHRTNSPVHG